ncbi:concanavalin A-like lectin/glucanase domain-containing protein [Coniochaeta sp. 2T2.1]|nr:concanavalin A-like lectin/glucanase domain-containing protein [Coniochaeta sp. 2T2.1]
MIMSRSYLSSAIALLASASLYQHVSAQVTTDCQPLNRTDCPPDPAFGMAYDFNFNMTPTSNTWETTVGPVAYNSENGAEFTISKHKDSPTIRSKFYIFGGRVEVIMRAAAGTGIISSVMFLSDDLDEIDWEFMGGNHTHAETNYFGKGVPDFRNAIYYPVNGGIIDDFHNYTTVWTKDALQFYIDSQLVRTLLPKDANNTLYYPQTPMRISLGIWAGGDPDNNEGTREWAGGDTDYSKGPFTMAVKSVYVEDFSSGKEYIYGDTSGSWESIRITEGNSTVNEEINAPPPETVADKWNKLPQTSKTAIYASAAGAGGLLVILAAFYCIRQRRRGSREAKIADAKYQAEQRELAAFKAAGVDPDSFASETGAEYNAKDMAREGLTSKNSYSVPSPTATTPINEKWQAASTFGAASAAAAAAANGGARSPMPLLHDGAQSPRVGSPAPQNRGAYDRSYDISPANARSLHGGANSPAAAPLISPMRTDSPAMPSQQQQRPQQFQQQPNRSFSSPNAQMRVGSPGPQQDYGRQPQSPANPMMAQQPPHRSFTTGGYQQQTGGSYGGGRGAAYGNGQNDQYWGGNNYR